MVDEASPRCRAVTRSGDPCAAKPRPGSDRCPWHDADLSARRAEWSRKGGAGRANAARARKALPAGVMTTDELRGLLGLTLKGVIAGRIEPGVGNAAASLARSIVAVAEAGAVEDMQRRLDELERLAARGRSA